MSDGPEAPQPPGWGSSQPNNPLPSPGQSRGFPPQPGYPPPQGAPYGYYQQPYAVAQSGNGLGIAGGVCGIVAVVLCWIPFVDYVSVVLGALAIVFGALGIRHANAHGGGGKGLAITGLVTGIVALVISVLFLAIIYAAVTSINANGNVIVG